MIFKRNGNKKYIVLKEILEPTRIQHFYRVLPFNTQWSPKTLLWLTLLGLCLSLGIFGFLGLGLGVFKLILVVKYGTYYYFQIYLYTVICDNYV